MDSYAVLWNAQQLYIFTYINKGGVSYSDFAHYTLYCCATEGDTCVNSPVITVLNERCTELGTQNLRKRLIEWFNGNRVAKRVDKRKEGRRCERAEAENMIVVDGDDYESREALVFLGSGPNRARRD